MYQQKDEVINLNFELSYRQKDSFIILNKQYDIFP
jgi:hypothetical protein